MSARRTDGLRTHGLSGDHGWSDLDEVPLGGVRSLMFLVAGTAYFGSLWLLSGLAPLPMLMSRLRARRTPRGKSLIDEASTSTTTWGSTRA